MSRNRGITVYTIAKLLLVVITMFTISCITIPYKRVASSPSRTYEVRLGEEIESETSGDPWPYKVFLSVSKHGRLTIDKELIYSNDSWDLRFGDICPEYTWVSDNILRLGGKHTLPESSCDVITVRNQTASDITYLMLTGMMRKPGEVFLLLDLQPSSTVKLHAQPQTDKIADMSGLSCHLQFADGREIPTTVMNFYIHEVYKGPARYCLTIKDNEIIIRSEDFEGIKFVSGNEVRIPKVSNCAPQSP